MTPVLDALYLKYGDFVYRVCYRYTRTREEAEDMTQEVFIRAGRGLETFREEASPSTWLYRMAIRGCIDHLRWKKRQAALSERYLDDVVARNLDGHGAAVEAKIDLEKLVSPLSPKLRQVIFLHFAEGLDYDEVGSILGMTRGAVANKILRFREKLSRPRGGLLQRAMRGGMLAALSLILFFKGGA